VLEKIGTSPEVEGLRDVGKVLGKIDMMQKVKVLWGGGQGMVIPYW
jgi:hypothetical protein